MRPDATARAVSGRRPDGLHVRVVHRRRGVRRRSGSAVSTASATGAMTRGRPPLETTFTRSRLVSALAGRRTTWPPGERRGWKHLAVPRAGASLAVLEPTRWVSLARLSRPLGCPRRSVTRTRALPTTARAGLPADAARDLVLIAIGFAAPRPARLRSSGWPSIVAVRSAPRPLRPRARGYSPPATRAGPVARRVGHRRGPPLRTRRRSVSVSTRGGGARCTRASAAMRVTWTV